MMLCKSFFKDRHRLEKGQLANLLGSRMAILIGVIYKKNYKHCSAGVVLKSCGSFATSF
ncbi:MULTISPECIES: hypothetical protein [unclassified Neochlamydia]|uniref:hypothetical protein n=1 Tax=unclassified Neochlamydia TaxID=2643326 RepID=UPI001BC9100C|nr:MULTISPECIES: hypothetical protein [unclassified Neochlamydia]